MKYLKIKDLLDQDKKIDLITIKGWIRTKRESKNVIFVALNDGSTIKNLQIIISPDLLSEEILKNLTTGTSVEVTGNIEKSQGKGQSIELISNKINIIGQSSPEDYPLQPKRHSMEFLRSIPHLRMRTNTFGAVFRVRNQISFAIHQFFYSKGFIYFNTPIITTVDAEGAGEMFHVSSQEPNNFTKDKNGNIDYSKDFFSKKTSLTVSGQLAGETGATALGQIYTFGPTFRAENSNTSRHLAEFWMVEPEIAFCNLSQSIDIAEEFIKYIIKSVLDNCFDDMEFLNKRHSEIQKSKPQNERSEFTLSETLENVLKYPFERITYTEAINLLKNSSKNKKKKFKYLIKEWGIDLQSEHERYLTEIHFKKPVVVTDYPKNIKAFYMYQNDDDKTVAAMDILIPGIGEIIGGSQREDRTKKLLESIKRMNVDETQLNWYIDTRIFGSVPHSGFGLGLERMVQFITGMENIRDVIPFPRTPGTADC